MERKSTVINERNYTFLLPAVRKTMPLCSQVAVLMGPMLATLGRNTDEGGMEKFTMALSGVDPIKLDKLLMQAVSISNLSYESQSICSVIDFERHFAQYRHDTYQVVGWVLWECVRDFFPQTGTFIQKVKMEMGKVSEFQKGGKMSSG